MEYKDLQGELKKLREQLNNQPATLTVGDWKKVTGMIECLSKEYESLKETIRCLNEKVVNFDIPLAYNEHIGESNEHAANRFIMSQINK